MEDNAIIALLFERDEAALDAAREKYGPYCSAIAAGILSDARDAEECVSDACLRAWNAIPPEHPSCLSAYLARITRNLALDKRSYNLAGKRSTELERAFEELEPWLPAADNGAEEALSGAEFRRVLNDFLRSLQPNARSFFLRRYWYGESIREIARALGCSEGTVKSSLFRTRSALRQALDKEGIPV